MKLSSVRMKLILWNVGSLALVLLIFGIGINYTVQARLAKKVDQDLARNAERFQDGFEIGMDRKVRALMAQYKRQVKSIKETAAAKQNPVPESPNKEEDREKKPSHSERFFNLQGHNLNPDRNDPLWDSRTFRASLSGAHIYSTVTVNGEPWRVLSTPLERNRKIEAVLQLAHSMKEIRELNHGLAITLLALIPLAMIAAGLGGLFLTDRTLRPIRRITQEAAALEADDLSRRLPVAGKDEFSELSNTFNGMIGRLEGAFSRLEDTIEQQRRFIADASHELRTPLTIIKANTSLALSGEQTVEQYQEALCAADLAANIMNRLVQDLLLLARSDNGQLKMVMCPVSIAEILQSAAALAARSPQSAPICIESFSPALQTVGDSDHLVRLFLNLLENALRHTPPKGSVTLSAQEENGRIAVMVEDTGEGIAPEHLPRLFERFYRVDAARSGSDGNSGLGLAICKSIAAAHHGDISIQSVPGQGTTVCVYLPIAPGEDKP